MKNLIIIGFIASSLIYSQLSNANEISIDNINNTILEKKSIPKNCNVFNEFWNNNNIVGNTKSPYIKQLPKTILSYKISTTNLFKIDVNKKNELDSLISGHVVVNTSPDNPIVNHNELIVTVTQVPCDYFSYKHNDYYQYLSELPIDKTLPFCQSEIFFNKAKFKPVIDQNKLQSSSFCHVPVTNLNNYVYINIINNSKKELSYNINY